MAILTTPHAVNAPAGSFEALGFPVIHVPETSSTQNNLRELWAQAQPWTTIFTDYQHAGRGRLGRNWESGRGKSLLATSLVCIPDSVEARKRLGWIPLIGALSLQSALSQLTGTTQFQIKWPNDVVVKVAGQTRKLAGILGEYYGEVDGELRVGLGVGCNLHQDSLDLFPGSTSLAELGTPEITRADLLTTYLREFQTRMGRWNEPDHLGTIVAELNDLLAYRGQEITVAGQTGVVIGVNLDANLELLADDKQIIVTTEDLALHITERSGNEQNPRS
ncbi:MAG: biotin--[acetyl-CoA-carboxylase] ligase [Actinomycetaceae bacterium]|nr:biotin--[acetyl-CoA-carboxylase] ligase [Actinomycetaceae bacterium]